MRFDWWTLGLQTVNFTILVWLLHHFLYKPVLRMIDTRRAEIEKHYADARAAEATARNQLAAIESERASIAREREAALEAARAQAEQAADARRAQAEAEAASLVDAARKVLATERDKALAEVRTSALDLGTDVARRLLAEMPVMLRAEGWLERIEQHLTSLPDKEVNALVRQFEDGAVVTVVTAAPLTSEAAENWRAALRRSLRAGIDVAFDVDPALIAGVELHFPSGILRFSLQSALAAIRSEIEA
jgi:F-type H+-transporting ATPase subunit b